MAEFATRCFSEDPCEGCPIAAYLAENETPLHQKEFMKWAAEGAAIATKYGNASPEQVLNKFTGLLGGAIGESALRTAVEGGRKSITDCPE